MIAASGLHHQVAGVRGSEQGAGLRRPVAAGPEEEGTPAGSKRPSVRSARGSTIAASDLPARKAAVAAPHDALWRRREFVLAVALVLLILGVGAVRPDFLSPANLRDILLNASIPAIAAAGMTALIVAAQIDISVGAVLAVAAVVVVMLGDRGLPVPVLLLSGVATGAALGAVNGALTAGLRIPSIVATLATLGAIKGLLVLATRGDSIPAPPALSAIGSAEWIGLRLPIWIAAAVCVAVSVYLSRTRRGRQHYAVGSNPRSAELSAVPVRWVTFRSFVLLGALVGLGGFVFVSRFSPIYPVPPKGFELEVITAVVVGGTDIFGGRGTVLGTVLAALLLSAIGIALTFVGSFTALRSEIQPAVQGLLILAAVLYNSLSRR
jgi:ribose/xylose/arabinose/galactoside ABC-type transport system permease subunit